MRKRISFLAAWQLTCWLGLALLLTTAAPTSAQAPTSPVAPAPAAGHPLRTALNPDGTLRPGAQGAFDPSGYELLTTPDGRPAFRPRSSTRPISPGIAARPSSTGGDWQPGFGIAGVADFVSALAEGPGGKLYVGFGRGATAVDTLVARGVICYDGTTWQRLGSGVAGRVSAIAVAGNDVYVSGNFSLAPGGPRHTVAHWDGTAWHPMGTGINGQVRCLAVVGTTLYAGGAFTQAGGAPARNIARWNGTAWSALGAGADTTVNAMAVMGTDLYVGGPGYVQRWNAAGWSPLGGGIDSWGHVNTLLADGPDLYVGGRFEAVYDSANGGGYVGSADVARWDGTRWHLFGGPYPTSTRGIQLLAKVGPTLYVVEDGVDYSEIWQCSGSTYTRANVVGYYVYAIAGRGTEVYAGGPLTVSYADSAGQAVNGVRASGLTRWDGTRWAPMPNGCNGAVYAVLINGSDVYVGGNFSQIGNIAANGVARWDGATWHALGDGVTGLQLPWGGAAVTAMAFLGTNLYVGGGFNRAGGRPAAGLARWDGAQWHSLGLSAGTTGACFVRALAASSTDLYVGGQFSLPGLPDPGIVRWDGNSWYQLPGATCSPTTLLLRGSELYVGGDITLLSSGTRHKVVRWDGTTWHPVGADPNFLVTSLAFVGSTLYMGGEFAVMGGALTTPVARWDGTAWQNVGAGLDGSVYALSAAGGKLYAAGGFSASGTTSVNRLAVWNDTTWQAVGAGLNNTVFALATTPTAVYAGGQFSMLADSSIVSASFAAYYPVGGTLRVNGFAPVRGLVGSTVVVTGLRLNGATAVLFNGVPAPGFTVNAAGTQITVTVPHGATTGPITVVGAAGPVTSPASFRVGPNGLPEAAPGAGLTLYPNPAQHEIAVCLTTLPGGAATTPAEILDARGRVVRRAAVSVGTNHLSLRGLAPGLYAVRAAGQVRRLVVE